MPSRSESESLRNGWLMQSRLQEMAVLGNRIRTGDVQAHVEGAVVVNSLLEGDSDPMAETRGRVLGGAVVAQSRSLGLMLKSEHHHVRTSALIGQAINTRFHTFDRGNKRGVATPKRDSYIELTVHENYRHNLRRFLRVIQAIPLNEKPRDRVERMADLEQQLQQPEKTLAAAMQLEAIGPEAVPVLERALASEESLVRFAAAEVLAYIGKDSSVPQLLAAARDESALRWNALTALGTVIDTDARDALATLHARTQCRNTLWRLPGHPGIESARSVDPRRSPRGRVGIARNRLAGRTDGARPPHATTRNRVVRQGDSSRVAHRRFRRTADPDQVGRVGPAENQSIRRGPG